MLTINCSSSCPHCHQSHPLEISSFQPPPPLVDKLLQQVIVKCDREKCNKAVHLQDLKVHLDSRCRQNSATILQSITVDQILQQPPNTPPTQIEMETAGYVIRKILSQPQTHFSLPTAGGRSVSSTPNFNPLKLWGCPAPPSLDKTLPIVIIV